MPSYFNEMHIRASLVDRLLDKHAHTKTDYIPTQSQTEKEYIDSIVRDLAQLFNTRSSTFEAFYESNNLTVIDYGIPDFSHYSLENQDDRLKLLRHLKHSIIQFEPRIRNPVIESEKDPVNERKLRLRIGGTVVINESPLRVTFLLKQNFESHKWAVYESFRE